MIHERSPVHKLRQKGRILLINITTILFKWSYNSDMLPIPESVVT